MYPILPTLQRIAGYLCMVISLASVNTWHGMDEQTACVGYPLSNVGRRGQFTSSLNMT